MRNLYTVILRISADYWVSIYLENRLVEQGNTPEESLYKLKEAIEWFCKIYEVVADVSFTVFSIHKLQEFLNLEDAESQNTYEVRKVYA